MNRRVLFIFTCLVVSAILIIVFVSWKAPNGSGQTQSQDVIEIAFPNLTFNQPVGILGAKDGTDRLFVIEQQGIIRVFENSKNTATSNVFLDISDRVLYGGEQGLLGLAFHLEYRNNGYFYINYMVDNPRRNIISRYSVSVNNLNEADITSEFVLMEIAQPFTNHNGGQLSFGTDGYLYISVGDGGSGGDPFGNGQNRSVLLGKILRIDVNSPSTGRNYSIPSDNPYFGNTLGFREEIYAYGFRNPWRFSFDSQSRLWVGDAGQNQREEIDIVEKGRNYGWNIMEGSLPYAGGDQTGLELPVWEYGRDQGVAIIGGYVYSGSIAPVLTGSYIYGDYGSGRFWAFTLSDSDSPKNTLLTDTTLNISSFGVDDNDELFICALNGKIYKFTQNVIPEYLSPITLAILLIAMLIILKFKY